MEREPIYLEKDDEITSVVDKLKSAEGTSLDIVIPKESLMLQSVINIKLLKRQAETLGKEITIVTQDKVGTKLAEQIGIPVVAKEGQTPAEVNMSEIDKPEFTDEDIELKEKKVAKVSGVAGAAAVVADSDEVVGAVDSSTNAQNDKSGKDKKSGGNWFKKHWKGASIAAAFGVLGLAVLAYIYVPIARIDIILAAEKKTVDISFTAEKDAREINPEQQVIPAREISEEAEKSEKFSATGEKDVGEKATGTATVYNNGYDSDPITIIAGTRLVTAGGLVYKTNSNATLPGSYFQGGNIVVTSVDVAVTADQVGDKYNIAAGTALSVPALNTSKIYGTSKSAFAGGSSKKVKYVTANDIAKAKEVLSSSSENEAKNKINEALEDGEIMLEGAVKYEEVSSRSSVSVGGEATEFEYTVKQKGTGIVFKEDDLKTLAEGVLGNEIGPGREVVEADSLITSTKVAELDMEKGILDATLAGEAYIANKIDQEELKNKISGDPEAVASEYLNSLEGVDSMQIKFFPSFYKRIPRINGNIHIKIEISKTQSE